MSDCKGAASKRALIQNENVEPKKSKFSEEAEDAVKDAVRQDFSDTTTVSVLNDRKSQKVLFLHGKFKENPENDAVIILEKKPFDVTPDALAQLLSSDTKLSVDLKNDIYSTYNASPAPSLCDIKATVIYPATQKHIDKYTKQNIFSVMETSEDYQNITKPFLEKQFENNVFNIQWVYNILDHKKESERILFEDRDPELGFILLPDMKWDGKDANSLYVIAIPHKHGIKSLRDLSNKDIPLLENIKTKALNAIDEKFGIKPDRLRLYFHYQPSYYHLHVHINHIELDLPGTGALRAHLLQDVIANLNLASDYYQRKTFLFTLPGHDKLLAEFQSKKQ